MIPFPPNFTDQVLDLACTLQQIPSPSFQENEKAAFIAQKFAELHLADIQYDAVGNVLGRIPGAASSDGTRPLVISAHMDTVFPLDLPLMLDRQPRRITGPGIGDNSLGLAGLLSIPTMLSFSPFPLKGDLWLAGTVCEEGLGNLRGIQALCDRFTNQPRAYISIEGIGLGEVLHRGLGVERYRIRIETAGGHSWLDYGAPSAVHLLTELAAKLVSLRLSAHPRTTMNIGRIEGGTSINTIAANAFLEMDLRSESARHLLELVQKVKQITDEVPTKDAKVTLERIGWRPAGELPRVHPLVRLAGDVLKGLGVDPHFDIASTDANIPLSLGYPAVTIGLTTGDRAHSVQEYIYPHLLEKGLQQLYALITRIWND
jgi:tripeptide aminopeptidase